MVSLFPRNALNVSEAITQTNVGGTPENVELSGVATRLGVDASTLSLRNTLDANGDATDQFVVKSGDDFYAASVDDTNGTVSLNTASVQYSDPDSGIATGSGEITLTDQLVKVGADETGAAKAFAEIQGGSYAIEDGALANDYAEAGNDFDSVATSIILSGDDATEQFAGASTSDPMALIDDALNKVDSLRSELGAVQNRFESAITNLNTNETNLSSARSRIEDADYAVEVANMTRAQILQQAGTSVLAQANQIPQSVLSLLG